METAIHLMTAEMILTNPLQFLNQLRQDHLMVCGNAYHFVQNSREFKTVARKWGIGHKMFIFMTFYLPC
jgi:hypothetical protein